MKLSFGACGPIPPQTTVMSTGLFPAYTFKVFDRKHTHTQRNHRNSLGGNKNHQKPCKFIVFLAKKGNHCASAEHLFGEKKTTARPVVLKRKPLIVTVLAPLGRNASSAAPSGRIFPVWGSGWNNRCATRASSWAPSGRTFPVHSTCNNFRWCCVEKWRECCCKAQQATHLPTMTASPLGGEHQLLSVHPNVSKNRKQMELYIYIYISYTRKDRERSDPIANEKSRICVGRKKKCHLISLLFLLNRCKVKRTYFCPGQKLLTNTETKTVKRKE